MGEFYYAFLIFFKVALPSDFHESKFVYMLIKLLRYLPTTLMKSSNWFSFFCYCCQLHSSELTVIEFGDWPFWHIFLSALRTNSLRFQAFLSAVFCLHQICSSSITQFSPLLLFPITK